MLVQPSHTILERQSSYNLANNSKNSGKWRTGFGVQNSYLNHTERGSMSTKCSGDIDGRVPVTSTTYSLNRLKLHVKAPWRSWTVNDQVVSSSKTTQIYSDLR
ncbi:hypothetical protein BHE74_00019536 [Ensete ventricosum]|uniref:Uncharacterized protein n=1 Tax=Ensete ventricosum TaxID=4639 RepID=A0A427AVB5_ENSVE|nr:hypothetical protein B296_00017610 [Ensete ventricosum]RWW72641.1 hypothetical protein BHE74_00019536 [Ensete ventricosum]RZR98258.1 hypothetical protein BHM03_00027567 [Ensete ventricosum]